jgi:hypothetical protein
MLLESVPRTAAAAVSLLRAPNAVAALGLEEGGAQIGCVSLAESDAPSAVCILARRGGGAGLRALPGSIVEGRRTPSSLRSAPTTSAPHLLHQQIDMKQRGRQLVDQRVALRGSLRCRNDNPGVAS